MNIRAASMAGGIQLLRGALRSRFFANVTTLASGALIGQIITVGVSPILSRQFSPADFAVLGVFASILAVLRAVAGFRYELAAVTAKSLPSAAAAIAMASVTLAGLSAASMLIALFWAEPIARAFGVPALATVLWLLAPALLFTGGQLVLSFWVTRRGLFRNQAVSDVARSGASAAMQIALGFAGVGAAGLVFGQVFGLAVSAVVIVMVIIAPDFREIRRAMNLRRLSYASRRFRDNFFFQTPKALLNVTTNQLPVMLVAACFGAVPAGLYWFVQRLLLLPMGLFGSAVQRVFFKHAADRVNANKGFLRDWAGTTAIMLALGLAIVIAVAAMGPNLFAWAFGDKWRDGWQYAVWLSFWFACRLGAVPAQSVYIVVKRQGLQFTMETVAAAFRLAIIPVGALYFSALPVIAAYSVAGAMLNILLIAVAGYLVGQHKRAMVKR